ncbi:hypothetical protein EVAR_90942_1 [Eumeta japonica]|uniref:Uncharacterized protein n=1 Tax=Eumeta variegata TaxID=151549 RepID=A0A4C1SH42_EUMVA|nr:hypothetical protein EVAR_90942_1 [Eumeta japonica]
MSGSRTYPMDERVEGDGILCAELVVKFNSFRPSLHLGIGIPPKGELRLTVWWIPCWGRIRPPFRSRKQDLAARGERGGAVRLEFTKKIAEFALRQKRLSLALSIVQAAREPGRSLTLPPRTA